MSRDRESDGTLDSLLTDLGGCGRFQVILATLLFLSELAAPFSMFFMSFASYNPGWRCMDNDSSLINDTTASWVLDTTACADFEACQNVQFNPDSSTVVSEWGLICDKAWIPSIIISLQMTGVMVGSYLAGYLGDKFGRRYTLFFHLMTNAILNFISYFSTSWQMFAVIRFFIGVTYNCLLLFPFILATEFSSQKWRSVFASLPTWCFGGLIFTVCVMLVKDWRQMQLASAISMFVLGLPTLWSPESLRWLALKKKKENINAVIKRIARWNQKHSMTDDDVNAVFETMLSEGETNKYNWRMLWVGRGLKPTLVFTVLWFTMALTYYVINFGVQSLSGNFYLNLILTFSVEIPAVFISSTLPNFIGRKKCVLLHLLVSTLGLFSVLALDRVAHGLEDGLLVVVAVMIVKLAVSVEWYLYLLYMAELYPTAIRATCLGYGGVVARFAGILAPYLIPKDPETYYICYSIMAALTLICLFLTLLLPETKGARLMDSWDTSNVTVPDAEKSCSGTTEKSRVV